MHEWVTELQKHASTHTHTHTHTHTPLLSLSSKPEYSKHFPASYIHTHEHTHMNTHSQVGQQSLEAAGLVGPQEALFLEPLAQPSPTAVRRWLSGPYLPAASYLFESTKAPVNESRGWACEREAFSYKLPPRSSHCTGRLSSGVWLVEGGQGVAAAGGSGSRG